MLTTFRAPLYPPFLSVIYLINGIDDGRLFAARLAKVVLGLLLAPLTYFVALHLSFLSNSKSPDQLIEDRFFTERVTVVASYAVAACPMLLMFPLAFASENLFFVLVLASVLAILKLAPVATRTDPQLTQAVSRSTFLYSLLSGLLLGLATLTRSVILPFAGLAILWIWFSLKQARAAIFTAFALDVTITPWIVHNSLLYGELTGIKTSVGYNLYVGYHPLFTDTFAFSPSLDLLSISNERVRDQVGTQRALACIRQDLARFPYMAMKRLGYFFDLELRAFTYFNVDDFLGDILPPALCLVLLILDLPFLVVAVSASFGAAALKAGPQAILIALLFIDYLEPHILILSKERFHLTRIPFFAILAAASWKTGFSVLRSRSALLFIIPMLVAALLQTNWGFELVRYSPQLEQMLGPNGNQLYLPY